MSPKTTQVTTLTDGPNVVSGDSVVVRDQDGNVVAEGETVYLCRCGLSDTKPMCDGSHRKHPGLGAPSPQ